MASHDKAIAQAQPFVDEWGIYDPDQAGLAAVLEKIEARGPATPPAKDARAMAASMREVKQINER